MTGCYTRLIAVSVAIAAFSASIYAQQETVTEMRTKVDQGDADSWFNLGVMYFNGRGFPPDNEEAVRWYRLAAN